MGVYKGFKYGTGVTYGYTSRIEYSVAPFTATSLDYSEVLLNWANPAGSMEGMRLVRNHMGYAETEEDGVILLDKYDFTTQTVSLYDVGIDAFGNESPLEPGTYAYYTLWIMLTDFSWIAAGWTYVLIPSEHNTVTPDGVVIRSSQDKFADLLPKVFLTTGQSYTDEIDVTSDLYNFLGGFSFTLDEILTYADLLTPSLSGESINPESLGAKSYQYGILTEPELGMQRQKRLLREATYIYKNKGTENGIETLVESITNYAPTITLSPNILLCNQDGSFRDGVGGWVAGTNGSLLAVSGAGRLITSATNVAITNGNSDGLKMKIPVTPGTEYQFSWYVSSESSAGNIIGKIYWYDYRGVELDTSVDSSPVSTTTTSTKHAFTATAPGVTASVSSYLINSSGEVVLTFASAHGLSIGDMITVSGIPPKTSSTTTSVNINGLFEVTDVTTTSPFTLTYDFAGYGTISSTAVTEGTVSSSQAVFAALELKAASANTYYFDKIQLADTADSRYDTYYEPRGITVDLSPSKINYIANPSFEDDTLHSAVAGWTISGGTGTAEADSTLKLAPHGEQVLQVVTDSTTTDNETPTVKVEVVGEVPTGQFVTFSVYARSDIAISTLKLGLTAADSASVTVSNEVVLDGGTAVNSRPVLGTSWQRLQVNLFIPSTLGQSTTTVTAAIYGETDGEEIFLDSAQLEKGYTATDYFDGALISRGASWTGTENDSSSILYVNKSTRVTRLVQELPKYLPINMAYEITTGTTIKTVESSGFSS